jgi:hypothetical protein
MALFLRINKVDAAQRLVYGTLSEEVRDKSDEILDYASAKPAFEKWSDEIKVASGGKSLGNVRAMHSTIAAGKFTDIKYDDDAKRIEGCAKIVDDNEWNKVVEGVYTGFSIGGGYARRWPDPDNSGLMRYTPTLAEVSIVDNPCVPTATFEFIKTDGSVEMRKFTPSHKEDSMDPKALADAREALAKGTATDEQKALIAKAEADALLKAAQDADAAGTATDEQKALLVKAAVNAAPALVQNGKAVKPKAAPVQKWIADDGTPFDGKREAEIHNLHLEKQAEIAPGLAQMDALLKAAKKPEEDDDEDKDGDSEEEKKAKKARREEKAKKAKEAKEKEEREAAEKAEKEKKEKEEADKAAADALGKKDYSDDERKEMADKKEALPDGSFPIKTKKDLENAIKAYGRAKDKDKAKAHIIARAKALKLTDLLPEDWEGSTKKKEKAASANDLQKGLHQVGWFAELLQSLRGFQNSVEMEQYFEGDKDSELPAKLKSLIVEMCEILVTLVEEETAELTEANSDTDVEILEMAAGLPAGHPEAIAKAARAKAEPLAKSDSKKDSEFGAQLVKFAETLEKAGARHSKADAERVQALHDHAQDVHKCMGEMAEKCADMHKAAAEAKNTAIDLGAKGERAEPEDDADGVGKSAVKMSKLYEQLNSKADEVLAITKVAAASNETLLKAIPLIEGLQTKVGTLEQEKSELVKRMEHLEKQPLPSKGHVRTVSKTQDSGGATGETKAEYDARLAKMSPVDRSRELMKLAMSNPMELPNL